MDLHHEMDQENYYLDTYVKKKKRTEKVYFGSKPVDRINYPLNLALWSVKLPTGKNHEFEMQK